MPTLVRATIIFFVIGLASYKSGMKICVVSDKIVSSGRGGAESNVLSLCSALQKRGHQIQVTSPGDYAPTPTSCGDAVEIRPFGPILKTGILHDYSLVWRPLASRGIAGEISKQNPDIIQLHIIQHFSSVSLLKALKLRLPKTPIVLTVHDYDILCKGALRCKLHSADFLHAQSRRLPSLATCFLCQKHTFNPLKRHAALELINRYCDSVVFVSDYLRQFYRQNGLTVPSYVIYSGVEVPPPGPFPREGSEFFRIICGGRMTPRKGYHQIINILPELIQRIGPHVRIRIYGRKNSYAQELERQVHRDGLTNYVEFTGWVEPTALPALLAESTLGIIPSQYPDPLPRTLFEYGAAGLPVLVTALGGAREILTGANHNWLFNPHDSSELANKVVEMASDLGRADVQAAKLQELILNQYTVGQAATQREILYNSLIQE